MSATPCPVGHPPNRREPRLPCWKCAANARRRARRARARAGLDINDDPKPRLTAGRRMQVGYIVRWVA